MSVPNLRRFALDFPDITLTLPRKSRVPVDNSRFISEVGNFTFKYSDEQPRDEHGRWVTGAGEKGGSGSGNHGHAGRPGAVGGSVSGGGGTSRTERATASYVPMTKARRAIATKEEHAVADMIGGTKSDDNKPFDVIAGKNAVEVKTIIEGKNPKITMHPESLARKVAEAKDKGYKTSTVVIDARGSKLIYYYKDSLGSFRLSSMTEVSSSELKAKYK